MEKNKASVLVVTLIILGIMLTTALSVSLISLKEKKASIGDAKSGQAFNSAQSGVELVMQAIKKGDYAQVKDMPNCVGEKIIGAGYTVELLDENGNLLDCSSTQPISEIASIKSVGTGLGQQRAIEAAVASGLNWYDISLRSGWSEHSSGSFNKPQCAVDSVSGIVYLRGVMEHSLIGGTGGTEIANLPTDCKKPKKRVAFPSWGYNNASSTYNMERIDVETDGKIFLYSSTDTIYVGLDGMFFFYEN